ncbi:MAG: hypothetical protein OHK0013_25200 [Sandaracinaceae bacterium]
MPYVYRAEIEIDASAERVWSVLVDFPSYDAWNPFTVSMRSSLEVGAPVDMRVRMSRWGITISQREILRELTAPTEHSPGRLVWGATMPGIVAERVQMVTPLARDRTHYLTEDTIGGSLSGLCDLLFGRSLDDGFRSVAERLAERVAALG